MKLNKALLMAIGGLTLAGLGYMYKSITAQREKLCGKKFVEQELETLEGEGGICFG